jgi:LysM repeat protein
MEPYIRLSIDVESGLTRMKHNTTIYMIETINPIEPDSPAGATFTMKLIYRLIIAGVLVTVLAAAVPAAFAAPPESVVCTQWHTVQRGENLFRIGLRYNMSVTSLKNLNGLANANWIYAGQALCVSGSAQNPPPLAGKTHIVQWGDTLGKIARTYGVDLYVLAKVNNIANVNRIFAGQVLNIPDFTTQS